MAQEANTEPTNLVIIGNGISGMTAADTARKNNPGIGITVFSAEKFPTYYRLRLCELLAPGFEPGADFDQEDDPKFFLYPPEWYQERRIETVLSKKVVSITSGAKKLLFETGEAVSYDKLILACGSASILPAIPGNAKKGVVTLWSLDDLHNIKTMLKTSPRVVIAGGGLLGLEAAYQLIKRGIQVSIVEALPHLLSKQLDQKGSLLFEKKVRDMGIDLYPGTRVAAIDGADAVEKIILDNGHFIAAQLILFTAGVKPNTSLAGNAGLAVQRGIVVDQQMRTSDPDIYACGDAAELEGVLSGQWATAINQGKVAGLNASGGYTVYANAYSPYFLNTMGIKLYSLGDAGKKDQVYDTLEEADEEHFEYQKLYFENGKCSGGIIMGNVKKFTLISDCVKNRLSKEEVVAALH